MTYQEAQANRLDAIKQGLIHYEGRPCKHCNNTKRYISDWRCVYCKIENNKVWLSTETGKASRKKTWIKFNKTPHRKEYQKRYNLQKEYGLSLEEFQNMKQIQDDLCFCCERKVPLVVDHDHETKEVRTLLCDKCNKIIGLMEENPKYCMQLLEYIKYCVELRALHYRKAA